jgi:HSP20 family protein
MQITQNDLVKSNGFNNPEESSGFIESFLGRLFPNSENIKSSEKDGYKTISIELPGVSKKNIAIELLDGYIIVTIENRSSKSDENNNQCSEFESYNKKQIKIFIGKVNNKKKINAKFKNGVLVLTIKKMKSGDGKINID